MRWDATECAAAKSQSKFDMLGLRRNCEHVAIADDLGSGAQAGARTAATAEFAAAGGMAALARLLASGGCAPCSQSAVSKVFCSARRRLGFRACVPRCCPCDGTDVQLWGSHWQVPSRRLPRFDPMRACFVSSVPNVRKIIYNIGYSLHP